MAAVICRLMTKMTDQVWK